MTSVGPGTVHTCVIQQTGWGSIKTASVLTHNKKIISACKLSYSESTTTTRFNPVWNANNKGDEVWKHTWKLFLLQLIETEKKIFSKEIMSNLQTKTKWLQGRVLAGSYIQIQFHKLESDWMTSWSYESLRGEGIFNSKINLMKSSKWMTSRSIGNWQGVDRVKS